MGKHYTQEELENNYEFKVVKRALMREFPFIKDVNFKHNEDINRWPTNQYINIDIDPFVLSQMYGLPLWNTIVKYLKHGESYWSPYLSLFIGGDNRVEDVSPINRAMEELVNGIHKSPAIPSELKLDKKIMIGSFTAEPTTVPPDITTLPN